MYYRCDCRTFSAVLEESQCEGSLRSWGGQILNFIKRKMGEFQKQELLEPDIDSEKLQSKLEADGLWMLRKGSCDPWEPAWFKARISQAQLISFYYWKRPVAWMLNLNLSKTFDQFPSAFIFFFTSWKAWHYL